MDDLLLLPYLSASSIPTLILPTAPLLEALAARRDVFPSGKRQKRPESEIRVDDRLAMPGVGGAEGQGLETAVLASLLAALQPQWVNQAWRALLSAREGSGWSPGAAGGKGKRRAAAGPPPRQAESMARGGSGGSGSGSGPVVHETSGALDLFDAGERAQLLTRLLDILSDDGADYFSPPRTPLVLSHVVLAPTLLPTRSHFVLATLSSAATSSTETPSQQVATRPLPSTSFPTFPGSPALSHEAEEHYLDSLCGTPVGQLTRDHDWALTSLGPISTWCPELRAAVSSILGIPFRLNIMWGPDHLLLYNQEYTKAAGRKHPAILGLPARDAWAEIWDGLDAIAKAVMQGETYHLVDHSLPIERIGFLEETYHTFSYSPFRGNNGDIIGIINISFETTSSVIAGRRHATAVDLVQKTAWCRSVPDLCSTVAQCFAENPYDIPFMVLYTSRLVKEKATAREIQSGFSKHSRTRLVFSLGASVGVPAGHPFAPLEAHIDVIMEPLHSSPSSLMTHTVSSSGSTATAMDTSDDTLPASPLWTWPFEEACAKLEPVFVEDLGDWPSGLEPRGWGDERARHAVVVPLTAEGMQKVPSGILVVGVNTRGQYDELCKTFFMLLSHHVASGLLAVTNAEADARREADLIALDQAKTSFFSSISHELRTPLTLVIGPLDDVLGGKEPLAPATRELLSMVRRHANRLLGMVNKLLDFSSLEGRRTTVRFHPVKLGPLTKELANLFRDAIQRSKVRFIVHCEDDPVDAPPIYLATDIWEKIVANLIGNSFKYCLAGTIEVTLRQSRAEAVLEVRDTGVGIPREELSKIFDRFHRIKSTARSTAGTGIGLALTLESVKVLGGQIEVESEVGKGSTFTVRLPRGFTHLPKAQVTHEPEGTTDIVNRPNQRHVAAVEEAASWRTDVSLEASSASSSSGSAANSSAEDYIASADLLNFRDSVILLADDSPDLRAYIGSILSKAFKVVTVVDGQAALDYCLAKPVSLVISDIMMPRLDGRALLAALRANPSTSLVPVIFLSAHAGTEARSEALEQGADDYLVKPFQARELLARVNVHLQLGRMRAELERRVEERTRALIEGDVKYRKLADRYSTLSLLSPVGIFLADAAGVISYANPRWYEISGHDLQKPLIEWRDDVVPEDLPKFDALWESALSHPMDHAEHLELRYKGGNWVQFELRAFQSVRSQDGFVGCITDITRQKQIEMLHIQTVEQRANDAEENRRQQEQYIDLASHELRNPLSAVWQNAEVVGTSLARISDFIEELRGSTKMPDESTWTEITNEMRENTEAIESIILCASHQGRIADDILQVSKLSMNLLTITEAPFDIVSKISEGLRMFEIECSQKGISLSLAVDPSVAALNAQCIVADASRITQILLNFLTNSIKFTSSASSRAITVHYSAFTSAPPLPPGAMRVSEPADMVLPPGHVWAVLGVEDSGKGLTRQELSKLFAKFSQANPKSDQYGGSGLGLYISKKLVELHRGWIEVESVPGKGSTFRFCIPAATAPHPTDVVLFPGPTAAQFLPPRSMRSSVSALPADALQSNVGAHQLHVLVVEDNVINQKVIQRQLKMEGILTTIANHGQEAIDILVAEQSKFPNPTPIAVVLMDIEMPVMDGLTAIRELRRMEATGEMPRRYPVIAVTGNARQGQVDECLSSGFDDTAIKPYTFSTLLRQIRSHTTSGSIPAASSSATLPSPSS